MRTRITDRICAAIFFLFGLFLIISIPQYTSAVNYDPIGGRFFPYAIGACILIVSGILAWTTFRAERYKENDGKEEHFRIDISDNIRAVLFCVFLFVSLVLIEKVHFLAGVAVMLTVMLLLCKTKGILKYVIVYAGAALAYIIFTRYFKIRL